MENPPLPDAQHTGTEFRDSRAKLVAMEDSMSDLYSINLYLQERLERDWRREVCAAEAAVWLDDAGLLRDYKRGLPLRRLLRAGRIAGQQQRPGQRNGSWWIRRLAESRDAMAIQQARRQIRRYLPIDRDILHAEWPLSRDISTFWEELGGTVATFGYLENELTSACYTLTAALADFSHLQPDQIEAHLEWYAKVEGYRADAMFDLSDRFDGLLREDGRVPGMNVSDANVLNCPVTRHAGVSEWTSACGGCRRDGAAVSGTASDETENDIIRVACTAISLPAIRRSRNARYGSERIPALIGFGNAEFAGCQNRLRMADTQ